MFFGSQGCLMVVFERQESLWVGLFQDLFPFISFWVGGIISLVSPIWFLSGRWCRKLDMVLWGWCKK